MDPKIKYYPTGVETINALISGEVGIGFMGTIPLLTSVSKGMPIVLVALNHGDPTKSDYNINQGVAAGPKTGIREGQVGLFKGKKVGVPVGTDAEGYFRKLVRAAGVSDKDVQIVNVKPSDGLPALKEGSLDGFACWEPWVSQAVVQVEGAVRVQQGGAAGLYAPSTVLSTRAFVDKNPDVVRRVLVASAESRQWIRKNLDDAAVIAMRWITGLDERVAKMAIRNMFFDPRLSRLVYDGYNKKTVPFLAELGVLKPFDAARAIEPRFIVEVEKAYPEFFSDLPIIPYEARVR